MINPIIIERYDIDSLIWNVERWIDTIDFCNRHIIKITYGFNELNSKFRFELLHEDK